MNKLTRETLLQFRSAWVWVYKETGRATHKRPPHKIPHEIHIVLARSRRHIRLLQIWLHGWVEGQLLKKGAELLGELFPFGREGDRGRGDAGEARGELFAGCGVGIHGLGVGVVVVVVVVG